jgi:hypothetical protein
MRNWMLSKIKWSLFPLPGAKIMAVLHLIRLVDSLYNRLRIISKDAPGTFLENNPELEKYSFLVQFYVLYGCCAKVPALCI